MPGAARESQPGERLSPPGAHGTRNARAMRTQCAGPKACFFVFSELRRTAPGVRPGNPFGIKGLPRRSGKPEGSEPVPRASRESFEGARPGLRVSHALRAQCAGIRRYTGDTRWSLAEIGRDRRIHEDRSRGFGRSPGPRGAVVVTDGSRSGVRGSADGGVGENGHGCRHCGHRQRAVNCRELPTVT